MVWATPYLKNEFGDPRFFLRFLSNLIILLPSVKVLKKSVCGKFLGANVLNTLLRVHMLFMLVSCCKPVCAGTDIYKCLDGIRLEKGRYRVEILGCFSTLLPKQVTRSDWSKVDVFECLLTLHRCFARVRPTSDWEVKRRWLVFCSWSAFPSIKGTDESLSRVEFIDLFDTRWSEWYWITDLDLDLPK